MKPIQLIHFHSNIGNDNEYNLFLIVNHKNGALCNYYWGKFFDSLFRVDITQQTVGSGLQ